MEVEAPWPTLKGKAELWIGESVTSVTSQGKALLTRFSNGDILYSHNQLYGRWLTRRDGKQPASRRTVRVGFKTEAGGVAYLYSATDIEVLWEQELPLHRYLSGLVPDILDQELSAGEISRRLRSRPFYRRQLAGLLLDQGFLAGPGNYLRSEYLFVSGLHPKLRPADLETQQHLRLARTVLKVSERAYRQAGVTVEPTLARKLKKSGERKRRYRHYVFGRAGQPCRKCGTEVVRQDIAGRAVFFCPDCQRR